MKNRKELVFIGVIVFLALIRLFIYKMDNIPDEASQLYDEAMFI